LRPTAIVDANVQMGYGNYIGPYCLIADNVLLGNQNQLISHVVINHKVEIGNNNAFYANVSIGQPGEMGAKGDRMMTTGKTLIGNNNTLRENVCIHAPIYYEETSIGNNCYLMNGSYIAHDVLLEDHVNLTAGVKLAGRVTIQAYANLGLNATVHQRCVVGESVMIGMSAVISKSIPPFAVAVGNPSRILKFNAIGAQRRGFNKLDIQQLKNSYPEAINRSLQSKNEMADKIYQFLSTHDNVLKQFKIV